MTLDLRKEFSEIYAHLVDRVQSFDPTTNHGPGNPAPVKMIELGFQYFQGAWVAVVFDTRPDASPDGQWTAHIEPNQFHRPDWLAAGEANSDGPIKLIYLDDTEEVVPQWTELALPLGEMLTSVLLKAREAGLFQKLRKTADCELGVEHLEGAYGWPSYEDRRKENIA